MPRDGSAPNVIVLFVDDLGYGDLGSYGSPDALTPHLDSLAARGHRFTDFYAGAPVCTPSRFALLTGRHAFRADDPRLLRALRHDIFDAGIGSEEVTLADALRTSGYETAMIGKWHLGHGAFVQGDAPDTEYHPLHHGFDSFFGIFTGVDYVTHWNGDRFLDWWEDRRPVPEDSLRYATHVFGERAEDYIDERPGAGTTQPPFFLYLPFTAPHFGSTPVLDLIASLQLPLGEEDAYLSRFESPFVYVESRWKAIQRKRYLAMVAVLDDEVGRIVDALDRNGLTENTVVWFISDNGGETRFGGHNGALRGRKMQPYEGGVRVPSFVVWPDSISPGVSAQVAGNVDVLPTLLSLAGAPPPPPVDGLDLSEHLLGGPTFARGIAVPNAAYGDAYRLRNWKLVRHYSGGEPLAPELYDLASDLAETTDVAAVYPDTVAMLVDRLPYGQPPGGDTLRIPDGVAARTQPELREPELRVFPNPFRAGVAGASVELVVPEEGPVRVEVFDLLGRRLATLHDGVLRRGRHRVPLVASTSGLVVVRAVGRFGSVATTAIRLR